LSKAPAAEANGRGAQGYLLPEWHKVYWIGLQSEVLPNFSWMDKLIPGPNATSYRHWGTYVEGATSETEPFGEMQTCAVANASQAYGSSATVQPWGWASQDCEARHPFLCRVSREHRVLLQLSLAHSVVLGLTVHRQRWHLWFASRPRI
jgi:hypothetical protein